VDAIDIEKAYQHITVVSYLPSTAANTVLSMNWFWVVVHLSTVRYIQYLILPNYRSESMLSSNTEWKI